MADFILGAKKTFSQSEFYNHYTCNVKSLTAKKNLQFKFSISKQKM